MATQQFLKCINCVYALWPQHAPGFCMVHNMGTMEAREPSAPCGPDAINYIDKPVSGPFSAPLNMEVKS